MRATIPMTEQDLTMTDAHGALIYTMVLAAASNGDMTDREVRTLGEMVSFLPVFRTFDHERLDRLTRETVELMRDEDGLDRELDAIEKELPEHLHATARSDEHTSEIPSLMHTTYDVFCL